MGFYGKIYEQMGDVFNRLTFVNQDKTEFTISAESHADKVPLIAGNHWINFTPTTDNKGNKACMIQHNTPDAVADDSITTIITGIEAGSDYKNIIANDSSILTDEEKSQLKYSRNSGNLLYFGDTITIKTPQKDSSGHTAGYKEKKYTLGSIPRLETVISSAADINNLKVAVGLEGYNNEDSLATRTLKLEKNFADVKTKADQASEKATVAASSAKSAQASASVAQSSAEKAQKSAEDSQNDLQTYQKDTDEKFTNFDISILNLQKAIGGTTNAQIEDYMKNDLLLIDENQGYNLITWNIYSSEQIADLQKQMEKNNTDIEELQDGLDIEITNRTSAMNSEAKVRQENDNQLQKDITEEISGRKAAILAEEIARAAALNDEAQLRAAADTQLDNKIDSTISAEKTRAIEAETKLQEDLSTESARAGEAEKGLRTDLSSLDGRITTVESELTLAINSEIQRAIQVEDELTSNIAKLNGNDTIEGSVSYLIKQETDARMVQYNELNTILTNETSNREQSIITIDNKIGELPEDKTDISSWIQEIVGLISKMQTDISTLQETNTNLQNKVNELETKILTYHPEEEIPPETEEDAEEVPPVDESETIE